MLWTLRSGRSSDAELLVWLAPLLLLLLLRLREDENADAIVITINSISSTTHAMTVCADILRPQPDTCTALVSDSITSTCCTTNQQQIEHQQRVHNRCPQQVACNNQQVLQQVAQLVVNKSTANRSNGVRHLSGPGFHPTQSTQRTRRTLEST